MAKIVARNKSEKGDVCSVKVLIGGSYADDNAARYFRVPVNKLVMPAESNDWKFDICLVQFPVEKPLIYGCQDFLCTSWGKPCLEGYYRLYVKFASLADYIGFYFFSSKHVYFQCYCGKLVIVLNMQQYIFITLCNYQYNHWKMMILFWYSTLRTRSLTRLFSRNDNSHVMESLFLTCFDFLHYKYLSTILFI